MVKLNKIYTKTGDAGTTGLAQASALQKMPRASPPTVPSTRRIPRSGWRASTLARGIRVSIPSLSGSKTTCSIW